MCVRVCVRVCVFAIFRLSVSNESVTIFLPQQSTVVENDNIFPISQVAASCDVIDAGVLIH